MRFFFTNDSNATRQLLELKALDSSSRFLEQGVSFVSTSALLRSARSVLSFNGALFNAEELAREFRIQQSSHGGLALKLLETLGLEKTLSRIKGIFNFIWLDLENDTVSAATDEIGDGYFLYSIQNDKVTIGSDLSVFTPPRFALNLDWVDRHFAGLNSWSDDCAVHGVRKIRPGQYLIFAQGKLKLGNYTDLRRRAEESFSSSAKLSLEEVAQFSMEILERDLRNLCRRRTKPVLLLSQGVDSILLQSVLKKIGIDCLTTTRLNTRSSSEVIESQSWLQRHFGIAESSILHVENETIFDHIDKTYYLEPGTYTWYTSVIEYSRQIAPLHQAGRDLFLLGHYGDHVFFHRARYAIADFLYANPKLLNEARRLYEQVGPVEATRQTEDLFRKKHPPLEHTYSFSKSDFSQYDMKEILASDSFPQYVLESHRGLRGINDDRSHRLRSGQSVYSPYANLEHLYLTLQLSEQERFRATTDLAVQKEMLRILGFDARHLTKSGSDYSMVRADKVFPMKPVFPWDDYIRELFEMNIKAASYFKDMLSEAPRDRYNARLIRLLTFFLWKENWMNASLKKTFGGQT